MTPSLISGKHFVDDRGILSTAPYPFDKIKRVYWIQNHKSHFIRAWHGHQKEHKYVSVLQGAAVVGAVAVENWAQPDPKVQPHRFVLTGSQPGFLHIPAGYANGFMNLSSDTLILFYSSATLDESLTDDVRISARFWDIWNVEER